MPVDIHPYCSSVCFANPRSRISIQADQCSIHLAPSLIRILITRTCKAEQHANSPIAGCMPLRAASLARRTELSREAHALKIAEPPRIPPALPRRLTWKWHVKASRGGEALLVHVRRERVACNEKRHRNVKTRQPCGLMHVAIGFGGVLHVVCNHLIIRVLPHRKAWTLFGFSC